MGPGFIRGVVGFNHGLRVVISGVCTKVTHFINSGAAGEDDSFVIEAVDSDEEVLNITRVDGVILDD